MKTRLIFPLIMIMALVLSYRSEAQTPTLNEQLAKAQTLAKQGNTAEALKIYTEIMANYPDNREAVMGWLMINVKGEEEAIGPLEELGKLYPKNSAILFIEAFIQGEHGHLEEALITTEKLITMQPDKAEHWILKGQILIELNRNEEALNAFEKALTLNPGSMDAWGMKVVALLRLGRYDEAIAASNKALELDPNSANIIYNRACIYCLKGDKVNALADLEKAIALNPQFKSYAAKDEDFKSLWDNEDFKKLTSQ